MCVTSVTFDSGEKRRLTLAAVCFQHRIRSFSPHINTRPLPLMFGGMLLGQDCYFCTLFTVEQKSPHPESECQAETDSSPRGQTDLLAHTLITGKEKSHSLEWLELLSILNEALVKMALNVSDHRKTPVLHSTVGCLSLQVWNSGGWATVR